MMKKGVFSGRSLEIVVDILVSTTIIIGHDL